MGGALGGGLAILPSDPGASITVTNNEMDNNGSDGMWTDNSTFSTLTIKGNNIHDNGETGVKIAPNVTGTVNIHNNDIVGNTDYGVRNQRGLPV
jgi:hypothetical protein